MDFDRAVILGVQAGVVGGPIVTVGGGSDVRYGPALVAIMAADQRNAIR